MTTETGKGRSEDFPEAQEEFLPLAVILAARVMLPSVIEFPGLKLGWESMNEQDL